MDVGEVIREGCRHFTAQKGESLPSRIGAEGRYHLRLASSQTENLNGKLFDRLPYRRRAAIDHLTSSRYFEPGLNQRRSAAFTTQKGCGTTHFNRSDGFS